jgi:hypothetical protein
MTNSTHTYAAVVLGTPNRTLHVRGGNLTLDQGQSPHVTGTLTLALPDIATYAALDPLVSPPPRVRVDVAATFPSGAQARSFNLAVRARRFNEINGTAEIDLASDESLLSDFAPLVDDVTPWNYQANLLQLVNYVLGVAIPGAVLVSTITANLTSRWSALNGVINPNVAAATTNWVGVNATLARNAAAGFDGTAGYIVATATLPNFQVWPYASTAYSNGPVINPGAWHTFSAYVRQGAGSPTVNPRIIWWDATGGIVGTTIGSIITPSSTSAWVRVTVAGIAPRNAVRASGFINYVGATGNTVAVDAAMLVEGRFAPEWFDGSTAATANYSYSWTTGTANASNSQRTALVDTPTPDAFVWRAGESAMEFLAPLVQVAGYRLVCDETRTWTLRDEHFIAPGDLTIFYGINMIDGDDLRSRDSDLWFDAAVVNYRWTAGGVALTAVDAYALTPGYSRLRTFERVTPYPGPGFAQYSVRRAQGRGRDVTVVAVADWRARAEQPVRVVLEGAPTQTGQTQSVAFDLDRDEMTVNTRTSDTPSSAWIFLAAGESWNASPVGASWISEVV